MRKVDCPELCETCPIRGNIDGEPSYITETVFDIEPVLDTNTNENVYSCDFENGLPISKRLSTLAVSNIVGEIGFRFRSQGQDWDKGLVEKAFENCQGPSQTRYGFLNLQRLAVCSALQKIN